MKSKGVSTEFYCQDLTEEQALLLTFEMPVGYSFLSTCELYEPSSYPDKFHNEVVQDKLIRSAKLKKGGMVQTENQICNQIYTALQTQGWRFQLLEECLSEHDEDFTSFKKINRKLLEKGYKALGGFIADINRLLYNQKLKAISDLYKDHSEILLERFLRLQSICNLDSPVTSRQTETFTEEEQQELRSLLPNLDDKYLGVVKTIVGKDNIKIRKQDDSEYFEIKKLPKETKQKLLNYVRDAIRRQSQDDLRRQSKSRESQFQSSGSSSSGQEGNL